MKIAFMYGKSIHWITPYPTLADVPEHPLSDVYIEVPDNAIEGMVYDKVSGTYNVPFLEEPQPTDSELIGLLQDRLDDSDHALGLLLQSILYQLSPIDD